MTELPPPPPPPPPPAAIPPPPPAARRDVPPGPPPAPLRLGTLQWVALGASAVLAIGAFLPWITVGPFSRSGVGDGGDGWFTLVCALACGAIVLLTARSIRIRGWIAIAVLGVLSAFICLIDIADVAGADVPLFEPSVGSGLILSLLASLVVAGVSIAEIVRRRRAGRVAQPAS